jgi:hypothetical protein
MPYLIMLHNKTTGKMKTSGKIYYTEKQMKKDKRKIQRTFERNGWDHISVHEKKV